LEIETQIYIYEVCEMSSLKVGMIRKQGEMDIRASEFKDCRYCYDEHCEE
jgi:hypothetical protein